MIAEGFWWTALAIAGLSAGAHLVSMMGTHWGDRKVSAKALGFSLLFHVALVCALFAVGPTIGRFVTRQDRQVPEKIEPKPIQIQEVISDADLPRPADEEGNVPIWEQPSESFVSPVDRSDREVKPSSIVDPQRIIEELAGQPSDIAPAETLADLTASAGPEEIESPIDEMPLEPAAAPEIAAESIAAARAEDRPMLARTDRFKKFAPGVVEPIERTPAPESSERYRPEVDPLETLADLQGGHTPAILPETDSPNDGMLIRDPAAAPALPDSMLANSPAEASGLEGESRMSTRIGRRAPPAGGTPSIAPAAERGAMPDVPDFSLGSTPARSSLAPLDPLGEHVPSLARIDDAGPIMNREPLPETYQLRTLDKRGVIARRNGGTQASEEAVERSLAWLAAHQEPSGYWDADEYGAGQIGIDEEGIDRQHAGKSADAGVTALAILAFLGAGYTHEEGKYAETVERALNWLIKNQRRDGFLGANAAHFEQMYCHGMATYALAEAYGMETRLSGSKLRRPLADAVIYIITQQGEDGGWRYVKGQAGDMSMFGWQLMALKSAEIAGIPIPANTRNKMIKFLKERSLGEYNGLAGYREGMPATAPMTAEALFCKQMLGINRTNPQSQEAVAYLLRHLPKRSELNYYYWYYGTLAMYQYGGQAWTEWNSALRDLLIAQQRREGEHAGSWDPNDVWGPYGGRVYSTAVATLSLEVYYRFLPLYRAVGGDGNQTDN